MKTFILLATVAMLCFSPSKAVDCDQTCVDKPNTLMCLLLSRRGLCANAFMKQFFCQQTCRTCKPCITTLLRSFEFSQSQPSIECETDCTDELSQDECSLIKSSRNGCANRGNSCNKTCGLCLECPTPPPPCSDACNNEEDFCNDWKDNGYCDESSEYHFYMQTKCQLSCGVCKLCSTAAPPNTALPPPAPTKPVCSFTGCEDNNPSCTYWADKGYCSESKGFPFTRVSCPKSCGVCIQCSTELPPTALTKPVCSEDCKESDPSCQFWKDEGYCDQESEFYEHMERACPATCKMCTPC